MIELGEKTLQLVFRPATLGEFRLCRQGKARVVDRGGGLRGNSGNDPFLMLGEDADLSMSKEYPAQYLPGARYQRDGEIAGHRTMASRHVVICRVLAITRILADVVRADIFCTAQRRLEQLGVARHRKFAKRVARRTRQGVKKIAVPSVVERRIKKRAELGARQFR